MSAAAALELIQVLNAAITAGINVRMAVDEIERMRALSPDGRLTDEQLDQIAERAHESVARLG